MIAIQNRTRRRGWLYGAICALFLLGASLTAPGVAGLAQARGGGGGGGSHGGDGGFRGGGQVSMGFRSSGGSFGGRSFSAPRMGGSFTAPRIGGGSLSVMRGNSGPVNGFSNLQRFGGMQGNVRSGSTVFANPGKALSANNFGLMHSLPAPVGGNAGNPGVLSGHGKAASDKGLGRVVNGNEGRFGREGDRGRFDRDDHSGRFDRDDHFGRFDRDGDFDRFGHDRDRFSGFFDGDDDFDGFFFPTFGTFGILDFGPFAPCSFFAFPQAAPVIGTPFPLPGTVESAPWWMDNGFCWWQDDLGVSPGATVILNF